jgi:hypothetical protein
MLKYSIFLKRRKRKFENILLLLLSRKNPGGVHGNMKRMREGKRKKDSRFPGWI